MASDAALASAVYEVADPFEANELFQRKGWTDGLPIVPPTGDSVRAFLRAARLEADHVVGVEPVRRRRITAEKVAIAAVMAGCLPQYMPVVVAVIRAMCEPQFGLHGSTASTGGSAPLIIVNGPVRIEIGMNATHNAFANASRANATIGRSVRLFLLNVLDGQPGQLDRSTLGHPGKFTFCLAEDEEDSPWLPLSVERGIPTGASAVTVMAVESPHQIMNEWTHDPKEILDTYAAAIRANMLTYSIWEGNYAMVIPCMHRQIFAAANWSKQNIRDYIFEAARVARKEWRTVGKTAVAGRKDEERIYRALRSPEDLLVIAAGGPAGGFGAIVPPWYGKKSLAVTMPINPLSLACGGEGLGEGAFRYAFLTNAAERRNTMTLKVLDPTLKPEAGPLRLAPALTSLEGAVIGMIDNSKIGAERFFDYVAEILKKDYGAREFIRRRKPDMTRPIPPEMLASLSGADAILSAIGD